jgi:hypothetical protein
MVYGNLVYFLRFGMFGPRKIWQPCSRLDNFAFRVSQRLKITDGCQGCQIFLDTIYLIRKNVPNEHKMYRMVLNIPNACKIFQMVIKYFNIFQSRALHHLPTLGFWVWKETIWQPWWLPMYFLIGKLPTSPDNQYYVNHKHWEIISPGGWL